MHVKPSVANLACHWKVKFTIVRAIEVFSILQHDFTTDNGQSVFMKEKVWSNIRAVFGENDILINMVNVLAFCHRQHCYEFNFLKVIGHLLAYWCKQCLWNVFCCNTELTNDVMWEYHLQGATILHKHTNLSSCGWWVMNMLWKCVVYCGQNCYP